jgi:4'-phosphopantetheinyl transferase
MTSNKLPAPAGFLSVLTVLPSVAPVSGEVLVVLAGFDSFSGIAVSDAENKRADSIVSAETKRRFLASRRLLRGILSTWLVMSPEMIPLEISKAGKPFLKGGKDLHFSIAHSADLVMIAFATQSLGADLEAERPVDALALARRFFSKDEAQMLEGSDATDRFFRLWSCREAVIKADGRGMATLLDSTKVLPGDEVPLHVVTGEVVWTVYPWKLEEGYHASVALKGCPSLINWCDLRQMLVY